ncbi:MAG: hypothetical protein ACI89U_001819 [Gammaproteobacteria bacterium]|jgi:hypothetical protein
MFIPVRRTMIIALFLIGWQHVKAIFNAIGQNKQDRQERINRQIESMLRENKLSFEFIFGVTNYREGYYQ